MSITVQEELTSSAEQRDGSFAAWAPSIGRGKRAFLPSGELVLAVDLWVVLAVLWASKLASWGFQPAVAVLSVTALALVAVPRTFSDHLTFSAIEDAGSIIRRVALAYALASAALALWGGGSPLTLLAAAGCLAGGLTFGRAFSYAAERKLRYKVSRSRTLIVGGGEVARRVVSILAHREHYGLQVVGAVDDDPKFSPSELGKPVLGGISDLPRIVSAYSIDTVIIAFGSGDQADLIPAIRKILTSGAKVWVVPRFFELGFDESGANHLWGLPLMRVRPPAHARPEWAVKRLVDITLAGLALAVVSPVLAVIALAIGLTSGRPILYRQTRVGMGGKPFSLLKFRTMKRADEGQDATEWVADADRVTPLGRFLRDSSLDEIPQLINVLRGQMSLVGPRPERPHFVEMFTERFSQYATRHRLPAGVTGWAQVHGLRGDTSIEERAMFDNHYIENWSLANDVKIVLRTTGSIIRNASLVSLNTIGAEQASEKPTEEEGGNDVRERGSHV
ncbi:MAG: sugar transferase [Actinomycetota bacterium]